MTTCEWQPIETAPEGRKCLIWIHLPRNPQASGCAVGWMSCVMQDEPENYGEHRMTVGCWWANGRYYHKGHDSGYASHWMHLPEPPK